MTDISNQFSDQEEWNAYARLLTEVLRESIKSDVLHTKFIRVTDLSRKSIDIQLKALRGFAKKYQLVRRA